MKQVLSVLMAMLLICALSVPVSAQTNASETTEAPVPTTGTDEPTTQPTLESPTESIPENPTVAPSTEPTLEIPNETSPETTVPATDTESCEHSWMYVEVNPTCTEYGGRGYICIYCETITDLEAINMLPHTYEDSCDSDCNVCGSVRTVSHKYSAVWSRNSTQHWHACSVCGAKSDTGSHYPGPAATEEKAQYCLTCGLMMMPKKDHAHQYSTTFSFNETEHWYACKGCEARKASEPHSYDEPCDSSCNICGYTSVKSHDYGSWQSDGNGHWKTCGICGLFTEAEPHILNSEQTGTELQVCGICDYKISAAPVHVHEGSEKWNCDERTHWKLCTCGEKTEEEPHLWDVCSETDDAVMLYICTACGAEKSEPILQETASGSWWIPVSIVVLLSMAIGLAILVFVKLRFGNR